MPFEVPESWVWVSGFDIFKPMTSKKPTNGTFTYIDINAIDNSKNCIVNPKVLEASNAPSRASREVKSGDTLFSMVRPYLMNIAYVDNQYKNSIASTGFFVCRPNELLFPKFLYYLMLSPFVVYGLNSFMKGDNSPSINNDNIISFQYPLPPLLEQYRIVDKIEKLFDLIYLINENKLSLEQYITQTKSKVLDLAIRGKLVPQDPEEEPASMLLKKIRKDDKIKRVSSDKSHYPFEVPEGWIACQLYEICDFERGVTFPSSAKQTLKRENTIACVRTANVQEQLELDDLWYIDKSFLKNNRKKLLRKNDIIISTANSKELVGKTSFVENINEEMCFGGFVMVIRTNFINNKFLFYYLRDCFYNGIFSKKASQTTNIANINTTILGNLVIKVPPPAEQQRIVNKIEEIFKIVDIMQENLQTNV